MNPASSALQVFDFEQHAVRVMHREGAPWFVAADVCRVLEIVNATNASRELEEDEKITLHNEKSNPRAGIPHQMSLISESGLYALIFKSRKPEAKRFRKWVTAEVLPALRETGSYGVASAGTQGQAQAQAEVAVKMMEAMGRLVENMGALLDRVERIASRLDRQESGGGAASPRTVPLILARDPWREDLAKLLELVLRDESSDVVECSFSSLATVAKAHGLLRQFARRGVYEADKSSQSAWGKFFQRELLDLEWETNEALRLADDGAGEEADAEGGEA